MSRDQLALSLNLGIFRAVEYGLPWMAKKSVEMGRYGASELMRNKNLQKSRKLWYK